jgi:hypothetical protein
MNRIDGINILPILFILSSFLGLQSVGLRAIRSGTVRFRQGVIVPIKEVYLRIIARSKIWITLAESSV